MSTTPAAQSNTDEHATAGPESSTLHQRPRIHLSCGRFLVWEPRHIFLLRCKYRLVGSLLGPMPGKNRQEGECGPPLSLLFEEALLAVEEGFADAVDGRASEAAVAHHVQESTPSAAVRASSSAIALVEGQLEAAAHATTDSTTAGSEQRGTTGSAAGAVPGEVSATDSKQTARHANPCIVHWWQ